MMDLKNTVTSSRPVLGDAAEPLERAMGDGHGRDLAKLERALLKVFASVPRPKLLSRPLAIEILDARGVIRVDELVKNHGIQARRLQRIFLEEIGVTAKVFSRIVRFNHAKSTIERNPDVDLPKLAYECGYADQPHFTRNFRELFGITPSAFRARMRGAAELLRGEARDVVFLQDDAAQPG